MHQVPQVVGCVDQLLDFVTVAVKVLRQDVPANRKRQRRQTLTNIFEVFVSSLRLDRVMDQC